MLKITSYSSQVEVSDCESFGGVNINPCAFSCVADLNFWGQAIYVAKRPGDHLPHILIAPSEKWVSDIRKEGFEIVGKLFDLIDQNKKI
jgi:hypothetical protein